MRYAGGLRCPDRGAPPIDGLKRAVRRFPRKLRAIANRFHARLGTRPPEAPLCTAPWVSTVIESDGTVRPCFFHEPVGNAREQGMLGAINSDKAVRFPDELNVATNPVCRNCVCSLNRPMIAR